MYIRKKKNSFTYGLNGAVVEIVVMTAPESDVRVESSVGGRVLLRVEPEMPFTNDVGTVAEVSKVLRQDLLV